MGARAGPLGRLAQPAFVLVLPRPLALPLLAVVEEVVVVGSKTASSQPSLQRGEMVID